jgi:hypothetical protein
VELQKNKGGAAFGEHLEVIRDHKFFIGAAAPTTHYIASPLVEREE